MNECLVVALDDALTPRERTALRDHLYLPALLLSVGFGGAPPSPHVLMRCHICGKTALWSTDAADLYRQLCERIVLASLTRLRGGIPYGPTIQQSDANLNQHRAIDAERGVAPAHDHANADADADARQWVINPQGWGVHSLGNATAGDGWGFAGEN